jgi:peroxiredoxin
VKQQGSRFRFLGLNAADTVPTARAFLKRYGWTWPSIVDPERRLARRLGIAYQPAVILIDAKGRLVAILDGYGTPARWNALKSRLSAP